MKSYRSVAIFSALFLLLVGCASPKSEPVAEPMAEPVAAPTTESTTESMADAINRPSVEFDTPPTEAEKALGVRIQSVRVVSAGYMVDLRFYVFDSEKSLPLADKKVHPYMVHKKSGAFLGIPAPSKIGSLRQKPRSYYPNRSYFMLFANPGGLVKSGDVIDVVAGDYKFENLIVE